MTELPDRLWAEANNARAAAEASEVAAGQARSSYHETIRRLHAAGASMRDIARRLEISHQRVHQIVSDTGCRFCGRSRAEVEKLVAGPGVFICDRCVSLGLQALSQGWGARSGDLVFDVSGESRMSCSFCRKRSRKSGPLVVGGEEAICGPCLALATAILQ